MSVFRICHIVTIFFIWGGGFVFFSFQPVLVFLCKCLSLSCVSSLHLHYHFSPSCSAEALGHHLPAPANPCISFPIAIPAGLWHGGEERTFPLWLYIWFNGVIIGAISLSLCVCVCGWRGGWCWVGTETLTSPRGHGHPCAFSLDVHTHKLRLANVQTDTYMCSIPQNPCL